MEDYRWRLSFEGLQATFAIVIARGNENACDRGVHGVTELTVKRMRTPFCRFSNAADVRSR